MLKKKRFTAIFLSLMLIVGISGVGMGEMTAYAEGMQEAVKTEAEEEAVTEEEESAKQEQAESTEADEAAMNEAESVENEALGENEEEVLQDAENNLAETDMPERTEKDEILAEEKREVLRDAENVEWVSIDDDGACGIRRIDESYTSTTDDLPAGVSYDASTNTLSINNAKIRTLHISRSKDLTVKVSGRNTIGLIRMEVAELEEDGGNLHITGTGTICVEHGYTDEPLTYFIWQPQSEFYDPIHEQWDLTRQGDIYIDGVTIISDVGLILSHYSNATIRNATVQVNNKYPEDSFFGITTGRASWGEYWKQNKYGGTLTIENSDMEFKNCPTALAWTDLNAPGCNYYLGKTSPECQADLERICWYSDYDSFKRGVINDVNYLKITSKNLGLPKAYGLIDGTASNAKGSISFSDGIDVDGEKVCAAGKKVNITVKPDSGYQLGRLYVNGKAISGTSFTMPAKDTTVKAEFVKKETKVTGVKITALSKKIAAGKKAALKATVSPSNASNKKVTWSVSNKRYASVNSKGVVTMKKAGAGKTITVTAKAADGSGKKASVKIKVMKGVVKKIKLTAAKSVKAGKKTAVKAKVTASKGANKTLAYSVSNKKYASVNSKGVVTTKKAGKGKRITVTAKATDGSGKKAVVKIKIK